MALLNLPNFNLEHKRQLKNHVKNRLRREAAKVAVNHFGTFWWVYLILLGIFLFFYIIAMAISSSQAIAAQSFVSEKFLPPQIYKANLEELITDGFGKRVHPVTGEKSFHSGIDIRVPVGTPVSSSQDGVVKKVYYPKANDPDSTKTSGIYVEIESSVTDMPGTTRYLHLSNALVGVGQTVKKGQIIGLSGNTGRSTGPHLHYELIPKDLEATDPTKYIMFMSELTDVASDAAFDAIEDVNFSEMNGFDFKTKPMLYISNVYLETAAPTFSETGTIFTRDMNTGAVVGSGAGEGGGGGTGLGAPVAVPTTVGVLHNPFFIKWAPYAMQTEINTGVKASVTLAQMALESGWGSSDICNNVFGIKANRSWKGRVCYADTNEQDAGGTYSINAGFRAYDSFQESFNDHAAFFHQNSRYANMLRMNNPYEIANELQHVTYATDWQYANKLKSIMMNDNLMSLDRDRGIDPSTGEPWKDIPYLENIIIPAGTFGTPSSTPAATPVTEKPVAENKSEAVTITFGIEQLYGMYGRQVHHKSVPKAKSPSSTTSNGSAPNGTSTRDTSSSSSTPEPAEVEDLVSYTKMIDPYTGKPIINLVNYNNVLNLYSGETQSPSIYAKDIPDAIAVTLESGSSDDLHVAGVDFIKGQY